jgi:hypothetical protein
MRNSTPAALFGCLLSLGLGCATSEGSGGSGGSSATGGSSSGGNTGSGGASGGSQGSGGDSSGSGGNGSGSGGNGSGSGGSNNGSGGNGSGGNSSSGGKGGSGTGGSVTTGGATGSGGSAKGGTSGTGGSSSGGTTGSGGSSTGSGGGSSVSCTITPTSSTSSKIGTVGIVTFTTTLSSPTAAQIDFGPDTSYGTTAPVDLTQSMYRTLLLGMKPSKMYHYRVSVTNASGTCQGGDNTIMTGAQPNGVAPSGLKVNTNTSGAYKGFIITGEYLASGGAPAYILDSDGTLVWWYNNMSSDACGARMSYDGQYMWVASANVPDATATDHVYRVTMDGLTYTDFTTAFAHHSHQVTPMPDGSVAFYTTGSNGCDDIKILPPNATPSTTATLVVNSQKAHGGTGMCHVNNIEYSPTDDALIFSDLDNSCLTKVDRKTGSTIWVLNGGSPSGVTSTFTGDSYKGGEHGFDIISVNDILLFNNNNGGTGGSQAIEFMLNPTAKTSMKAFSYQPSPAINVMVLGDVQRLPNGNTIVDFGTGSRIQEVDKNGTVVLDISSGVAFGFFEKRATLYGPSTK